ncbi:MAG TPA: hypothetical protein VE990_03910 [Acidimicrobiales bacterium]|nr:hypothetical protein [Acidimicrobiales bacterium]
MPDRSGITPPPEPEAIKAELSGLARQDPAGARARLADGHDLADLLWSAWGPELGLAGADRAGLVAHLAGARREVWLWVMGERTWDELARLVSGGVLRRALVPATG